MKFWKKWKADFKEKKINLEASFYGPVACSGGIICILNALDVQETGITKNPEFWCIYLVAGCILIIIGVIVMLLAGRKINLGRTFIPSGLAIMLWSSNIWFKNPDNILCGIIVCFIGIALLLVGFKIEYDWRKTID